jgi:RNA polymerase sigma factor (sigma-70 family)
MQPRLSCADAPGRDGPELTFGATARLGAEIGRPAPAVAHPCSLAIQAAISSLAALARRIGVRNSHDVDDLVQDTMVRALQARPGDGVAHVEAWLATILRNLWIDDIRQRAREPRRVSLDDAGAADHLASLAFANDDIDVGSLGTLLQKVPKELRGAFVLYELEGMSYRSIAVELGIPLSTVGTRIARARSKLRELLR